MIERIRALLVPTLGVLLCLFTLAEVNYPYLQPQTQLAVFGLVGVVLCYLLYPSHPHLKDNRASRLVDLVLAAGAVVCFGYIIVQTESVFERFWFVGQSLGNRAGAETSMDYWIGLAGLALVIEATRRSIGLALPILAFAFMAHAYFGEKLPEWLLPHAQMRVDQIVSVTFLQSLGVFGPAMTVMFKYVFLFVVFGAFLEATGATQFIVDFADRIFGNSPGGPAKVSVLGSGLMGSLSGSAVANAVTTGTFTIPMMRNAGFQPHVAGGITAAAASGGALVPPVMGAGAYMMLEIVDPPVSFLQVARAALIPAMLYYFSIFMIVHFYARRTGTASVAARASDASQRSLLQLMLQFEGVVFFGALISLITFLLMGYSPFRAVTFSLGVIIVLGLVHPRKRLTLRMSIEALTKSARNGVSLVSASACVGIVIGIVQATGVANDFNVVVAGVVENSLFLALVGIMACSIVLGMGVPSVVCYLLMATMMGPLLKQLGVIPLAAHLFIFYFGMMSMVTPPVALAAFASASIAGSNVMRTALSAFLFSLVGFTLPFMFIYRPELLLMSNKPEVTVSTVAFGNEPMASVTGSLNQIETPVAEAELQFLSAGGSNRHEAITTDGEGRFRLDLPTSEQWEVAWVTPEGPRHLGRLDLSEKSREPATTQAGPSDAASDRYLDQRLSALQVLIGTAAAAIGIVAFAVGIAGYLWTPVGWAMRILSFAAAGLLLYPGRGFLVGDVRVALSDLAGLALFVVLALVNRKLNPSPSQETAATT